MFKLEKNWITINNFTCLASEFQEVNLTNFPSSGLTYDGEKLILKDGKTFNGWATGDDVLNDSENIINSIKALSSYQTRTQTQKISNCWKSYDSYIKGTMLSESIDDNALSKWSYDIALGIIENNSEKWIKITQLHTWVQSVWQQYPVDKAIIQAGNEPTTDFSADFPYPSNLGFWDIETSSTSA